MKINFVKFLLQSFKNVNLKTNADLFSYFLTNIKLHIYANCIKFNPFKKFT